MSKSYRDRNAYYARNKVIGNVSIASRSHIRQQVMAEHGRKLYGDHNTPLDVKKAFEEDKYIFYRGNTSSNLRKQNSYLKRKKSRIERARNNRVVEQELKAIQKESMLDIEEMNKMMADLGFE